MRLPIAPAVETKDGVSNKNARMTNCLQETNAKGELARVRPGLAAVDTFAGLGNGLIPFNGKLLFIGDDTVYEGEWEDLWWPLDADEWSAAVDYGFQDAVWYLGDMWFWGTVQLGAGQPAPGGSYWRRSMEKTAIDTYSPTTTYGIGDFAVYEGVKKYCLAANTVGVLPSNTDFWATTAPGTSRYQITNLTDFLGSLSVGSELAATRQAAAASGWAKYPYKLCSTPDRSGNHWFTGGVYGTNGSSHWLLASQWIGSCGSPTLQSTGVSIGTITTVVP